MFLLQLDMIDVCTVGDTAYIDTKYKLLPHTRERDASIFFTANMIRA
jgi:hypothetical protein